MLKGDLARSFRQTLFLLASATVLACTDITGPIVSDSGPSYNVTAQSTGDVYIMLRTDPHATAGTFSFEHTFGTISNAVVVTPFVTGDGGLAVFNRVAAGSYTATVTVPADWEGHGRTREQLWMIT